MSITKEAWKRIGTCVYQLQPAGFIKGAEQFENRFTIGVQGGNRRGANQDELEEVARAISAVPELIKSAELMEEYEKAIESGYDVTAMHLYAEAKEYRKQALAKAKGEGDDRS